MSNFLSKSREVDMCTGPLFKKILVFTVPMMLSNLLQILFNAADTVVVGRFSAEGSDALAAVGTTTSIIYLIINLVIGLSVGTNVLVARYYGAKDYKRLSGAVHTSIVVGFISGAAASVAGVLLTPALLRFVGAPADVFHMAEQYMKIYFAGFVSVSIYNFGGAILRGVGDTQRPLIFMLIAGILNVVLNLFFVIVLQMSVAGVAIATVISQTVSAVLILITLMKTQSCYRVEVKKLRCDRQSLKQIAIVGIPAGIQGCLFSLSNAVVQSSINTFGKVTMAGNTAACNVEGILYTMLSSLQYAALAFTSQNIGAGNFDMVKRILKKCLLINLVFGIAVFAATYLAGTPLLEVYDAKDPEVIAAGLIRFRYVSSLCLLCSLMEIFAGMMRGLGYSLEPTIVTLIGSCVFRIVWLKTVFLANHTLGMVYIVYPISWALTSFAHIVCFILAYRKKKRAYAMFQPSMHV